MLGRVSRLILCSSFLVPNLVHPVRSCGPQTEDRVIPYRILSNEIKYKRRWIDILIDEKDFSINNLKLLMNDFFPKYPRPERLMVYVATNTSQLGDFAKYSDPKRRPAALHPSAGLLREKDKDFINYKFPGEKPQTLVIREKTKKAER